MDSGTKLPKDATGNIIQAFALGGPIQRLALSTTAVHTANFSRDMLVRISANVDCFIAAGDGVVATQQSMTFKAGAEVFHVQASHRISAIVASGSGELEIVEAG